jgi:hypothetical protein
MSVTKVTITPTLKNKEAQAGKRDRFYFAAGSAKQQEETDVEVIREGGSEKFETLEIDINPSDDEVLRNDPFIYITCIEVDGAKDDGVVAGYIEDTANQVVKFLNKSIEKIPTSSLLKRCLILGLNSIVNLFRNLFEDDLVGKEAIRIPESAETRKITSTYKNKEDERLDYEYEVTYEVEFS